MIDDGREWSADRRYDTTQELARYLAEHPELVPVLIHVVGPPGSARILLTPHTVFVRQHLDGVVWGAGANCGDWEVEFKDRSPLDPSGPYSSSGPAGGSAVGDVGLHPYSVRARDLRDGGEVEVDPEVVIIPDYMT